MYNDLEQNVGETKNDRTIPQGMGAAELDSASPSNGDAKASTQYGVPRGDGRVGSGGIVSTAKLGELIVSRVVKFDNDPKRDHTKNVKSNFAPRSAAIVEVSVFSAKPSVPRIKYQKDGVDKFQTRANSFLE